jgi:hypothetical protein
MEPRCDVEPHGRPPSDLRKDPLETSAADVDMVRSSLFRRGQCPARFARLQGAIRAIWRRFMANHGTGVADRFLK